ncbi:hypothetical protein [Streptomyces sp. H27-C3]|uniref:hypothetical protein n=1 Tax=Streptomyces sp. H27-C3 TaxID=3046305 RepID=UPI0024B929D0|nr:hypothetical protein [Streptomyces sp. H27-C3]MDJ0464713.1 hypothetical protein [Streptomyces sp. H27-C3]
MQFIDLAAQTRLLSQTHLALRSLRADVEQVRAGDISKPVRELAPIAVGAQELATRCTQQLEVLSTSQYAAMKDGHWNLAKLAEASAQVSHAGALCARAIHARTETLLYEDADETPEASRTVLAEAAAKMGFASQVYVGLAQQLSRRTLSAAAQQEDQQLIKHALAELGTPSASATAVPAVVDIPPLPAMRGAAPRTR